MMLKINSYMKAKAEWLRGISRFLDSVFTHPAVRGCEHCLCMTLYEGHNHAGIVKFVQIKQKKSFVLT